MQGLQAQAAAVPERKTYGLTPRQLEVVSCIVEGCSNRDIAKQFTISEETVKRHLSNVFDKTGVSTRLELALFAIAHKLVEKPKQEAQRPRRMVVLCYMHAACASVDIDGNG